jgi:hypothetical protein
MTAITRPFAWAGGSAFTGSRGDQDHDAILLAQDPPGCIARRTTTQSINNTTFTAISFNSEVVDNDSMFAATSTDITIQHDGYYLAIYGIDWATNTTGTRVINILQNAVAIPEGSKELPAGGTGNHRDTGCVAFTAVTSDVIRMEVWQNSGGALNVDTARLAVVRLFGPGS